MKKFLFTIVALTLGLQMNAQTISFGPLSDDGFIEVPQGGQADVAVMYTKESEIIVRGYKFTLTFTTEFVNTVKDNKELPVFTIDPDNDYFVLQKTKNNGFSALPSSEDADLKGTAGTLGTLQFQATADAEIGSTHEVKVSNAGFSVEDESGALRTVMMDDFSFTVKIVENRVPLDENSTTAPAAAENVNVLVKRSVKAGNWGTICLPFAMTKEQVQAAFGTDDAEAKLADFKGAVSVKDEDGEICEIKVKFESVTSLEANHPYLLKSEKSIEYKDGFMVDGVTINAINNPQVGFDYDEDDEEYKTYFKGVYVPTNLDKATYLFLSGNKFYYSNGSTTMKGFRGYFKFKKSLGSAYKNLSTNVKIFVDDEATYVDGISQQRIVDGVYDLSGRKIQLKDGDLNKLQKGVYIINGKKVTIK